MERARQVTSACASQHPTAHKPTVRRQTPTPACAVAIKYVRQPLVFTATAQSAHAVQHPLLLAQKQTDFMPTQSLAFVAVWHVLRAPVSSATPPTVNVHLSPFQIVSRQMAQQLTEQRARAGVWSARARVQLD